MWLEEAVVYQVYVRSFQDSDGDGVGDLPGITARLEHIAGLGADAVWLTPICWLDGAACGTTLGCCACPVSKQIAHNTTSADSWVLELRSMFGTPW